MKITYVIVHFVIQKINGYEILKTQFKNEEKHFLEPIDVIYEPVNDKRSIECYFNQQFAFSIRILLF